MRHSPFLIALMAIAALGLAQPPAGGSILAWGWDLYGLLEVSEPNADYTAICSDDDHCLAIRHDSSIVAWG